MTDLSPPSSERLVTASNLSVIRQKRAILDDVSLNITERDFITLIGPNGAGKTVFLRHLLKLDIPNSGSVTHRADLKIGYVPQRVDIDPGLPISVNRFLTLNNTLADAELEQLANVTKIQHLLDTPLSSLSGGELQRVLLTRALTNKPDLLILDEPAQNLDVNGQLQFYTLIEEIYESRNIAILMVSHDLHLVMSSTRKVVCLYHHICCSGAPESVARDPEFISIFGNDMAKLMAVYPHTHAHDHDHDHGHGHDAEDAS
jgi:zinc transport system ATP-binding protein